MQLVAHQAQRLVNIQVTPGSLNWLAMVGYTGTSSSFRVKAVRLRFHCLRTSRSASSAPRLSNLLSTTSSAKSSMSIFFELAGGAVVARSSRRRGNRRGRRFPNRFGQYQRFPRSPGRRVGSSGS